MDNRSNIENVLNDLEESIGILIECINIEREVHLKYDTFATIIPNIKKLEGYNNQYLGELGMFLNVLLAHLSKTFNGKDVITSDEIDDVYKCLNDIKTTKKKIDSNNAFNKFFEDLKSISRNLNGINSEYFLRDSEFTKESLINYENILNKYRNIIDGINEIKSDMKSDEFENLLLDLNINYSGLKANLNKIYNEIINSNIDIAEPLLNKLKKHVDNENYEPILRTNMVNKLISNGLRRKDVTNNYNMLIESLDKIVDRYKDNKVNRSNTKIDVEIPEKEIPKDYEIDIPAFIEENYDEHKRDRKRNYDDSYDTKVAGFIARFEILKRRLQNKRSLTKEDVKLFNKLESELDIIKGRNRTFVSGLRFNYYYKKLNKNIKLSRKNNYKQVTNDTKKRK